MGGVLLLGGWGAVGAAMVLPFWRTVHPDQVTLRLGFELSFVVLPLALGGGLASVASLALPARSAWRQASRGFLLGNALSCGSLTGVGWLLTATDPYAPEHGVVSSGPGAGLFLALLGCLLVPLTGSLPPSPTAH
ncbi:hypothetical protein [Micromonospora rubida]|uniref:hypothetical protein n=1 Tax=Micromonospora rubida TaxID=2697657 RepID=UPI001376CF87|nr:hypothetical protein [Micromonospora rubida]NBE84996.1 hypothetical protein [Micromonospora rubida]